MSEPTFEHGEIEKASMAAMSDVFGNDTRTAEALTASIMSRLILGTTVLEPDPIMETRAETDGPDFTRRALNSSSAKELHELLVEAGERLSLSIASYNDNSHHGEKTHILLTPWVFAEGSKVGEGPILGSVRLHIPKISDQPPVRQSYQDENIAWVELRGGEDSPFDPIKEGASYNDPHMQQTLTIYRKWIEDPVSKTITPLIYAHREQEFRGYGPMSDGLLYSDDKKKDAPNPYGQARLITADIFWALDNVIRYYEEVYIAGLKGPGLTYADYRDAGCLGENGKLDGKMAEAYVKSRWDDSLKPVEEGRWPLLRDPEVTALTIPERNREFYDRERELIRMGQGALRQSSPV